MDAKRLKKLQEEAAKRQARKERLEPARHLFREQLGAFEDPAKAKCLLTSRRAGKSTYLGFDALNKGLRYENCVIPFVYPKGKPQGKRVLWPVFRKLSKALGLELDFNNHEAIIGLPNKSQIIIVGAQNETEIAALRGGAYPAVYLDEAQDIRDHIAEILMQDVVEPALMDYDGTLNLAGTPDTRCAGFFYDITEGNFTWSDEWSIHRWTCRENPHLENVETYLNTIKKRHGWTETTPKYVCEYLGRWVHDSANHPFRINQKSIVEAFEKAVDYEWRYILGIDLGYRAPSAFVVVAYNPISRQVIVEESEEEAGLIISALAARIEKYRNRFDFEGIVVDPGGLGIQIIDELRETYGLPVEAAPKKPGYKATAIEKLNGDVASGLVQIIRSGNRKLLDDMKRLQWNDKKTDFERGQADHLADALIYAWMRCRHRYGEDELNAPRSGSKEYWARFEEDLWDEVERTRFQPSSLEDVIEAEPDSWLS